MGIRFVPDRSPRGAPQQHDDEPPPRSREIGAIALRPGGEVASELLADSEETDNRAVVEGHLQLIAPAPSHKLVPYRLAGDRIPLGWWGFTSIPRFAGASRASRF
jgi:hypothetical protein